MTSRYRVEYALKTHRRDQFIEWIKGLLAVPFVLHSYSNAALDNDTTDPVTDLTPAEQRAHDRYADIMLDVEGLIANHIAHQESGTPHLSQLRALVPTIGALFTPLALRDGFARQDRQRAISRRRLVAPSFNDVRLTLNSAQLLTLARAGGPALLTFDGDVTLYDDGASLRPDSPVVPHLLRLLASGVRIGIVTAAGYTDAARYHERLAGLLDAVAASQVLTPAQQASLVVMGGEANYLFAFDATQPSRLRPVPHAEWALDEMSSWSETAIAALLDAAEATLTRSVRTLRLDAHIVRKARAVGIVPSAGVRLAREALEETVLAAQRALAGSAVPFCAFNGGADVFVDVGDKSYGVAATQRFFGGVAGARTLHVGDQFLSAGANDFKARSVCATAWIASPEETVALLEEMEEYAAQGT